jgi:hypothetical protein
MYLFDIVTQLISLATVGVLLLIASPAHAIAVSGLNPDASSYLVSASSPAVECSGVAGLLIVRSDCPIVEESSGEVTGGAYQSSQMRFEVDPPYDGNAATRANQYDAATLGGNPGTDIDRNSSLGTFAGDVRVISKAASIQSMIDSAPEPKTMFLVGVALVAFSLMGVRTRRH